MDKEKNTKADVYKRQGLCREELFVGSKIADK